MSGQIPPLPPTVNRVLHDAQMFGDLFGSDPRFRCHGIARFESSKIGSYIWMSLKIA